MTYTPAMIIERLSAITLSPAATTRSRMLTYIRYALATCCFAASVGCFALWWRNHADADALARIEITVPATCTLLIHAESRLATAGIVPWYTHMPLINWKFWRAEGLSKIVEPPQKQFGVTSHGAVYFPLWYPILIFGLAGIAALRLGRRFTLRSAIIATTVVAGLLGDGGDSVGRFHAGD